MRKDRTPKTAWAKKLDSHLVAKRKRCVTLEKLYKAASDIEKYLPNLTHAITTYELAILNFRKVLKELHPK